VPFTTGPPAARSDKPKVLRQLRREALIRLHFSLVENCTIAPIESFTIGERNVAKLARSSNFFAVARVRFKRSVGTMLIS
jgi:hypothetical protein